MTHPAPRTTVARSTGVRSIYDVAALAGVSLQTVSRVVNGSGPVRASTREQVLAAMAELEWVPNPFAQALGRSSGRPTRSNPSGRPEVQR